MKRLLYDVLAAHQLWIESNEESGEPADLKWTVMFFGGIKYKLQKEA